MRNTAATHESMTQQGFLRIWTNVDTRLMLTVVEPDGTRSVTDITEMLGTLVAHGLRLSAPPSAAALQPGTAESVEPPTVELGSVELNGGCRVLLDGRRLRDQDVLALAGSAIVDTVTAAARQTLAEHPDTPTP